MDAKLIEENRKKLEAEKARLEKLLQHQGHKKGVSSEDYETDFPNIGDTPDENAQEVAQYETNLGKEKVLEERLHKVNAALERIKNGTYGKCAVGGEEIEEARLRVAPDVDTCVKHGE